MSIASFVPRGRLPCGLGSSSFSPAFCGACGQFARPLERISAEMVSEDICHVAEQAGNAHHSTWLAELIQQVEKQLGVLVALGGGEGQPVFDKIFVLWHFPCHKIKLSQRVLSELIFGFCRTTQIFQRLWHVFRCDFASQMLFAQPVPGM